MQHATKKLLLDLADNLQMFAEDGANSNDGSNGGDNTPPKPKHTDEEYEKLKASFDKNSSEIAELKKQLKAKQTDEEKKAEEEQNRLKEMDDLKKEVANYKIQNSLQEVFEKEEVEKISKSILSGDIDSLVKTLVDTRKAYKDKIYKQAKDEFSKSANIPGGSGNNDNSGVSAEVQNYLNSKKNKTNSNLKEKFFGEKQVSQQ